jgi:hypothetical protein
MSTPLQWASEQKKTSNPITDPGGIQIDAASRRRGHWRESDAFFQMSESQLGDTSVVGTDWKEISLRQSIA